MLMAAQLSKIDTALDALPWWAGTVPQWGLVLLLAIAVVRTSPQWLSTWSTMRLAASNHNRDRIKDLEDEVHRCHRECEERIQILQDIVQGLREQRNAEQLAIMRAIVRMSGDPQVKHQLDLLESMEVKLEPILKGADDEDKGD